MMMDLDWDSFVALCQENAFYGTVILLILYMIFHSSTCTQMRKNITYKISQNPARVTKLAAEEKEIRLLQALRFQKEQDTKREERKFNKISRKTQPELSRAEFEAARAGKSKNNSSRSSYNPLTGSGGGSSSYRPTNRRKKSGG